jgi:DMSO/TMAO reductase YedYZ molybdopterin-dependent catalytic subunit
MSASDRPGDHRMKKSASNRFIDAARWIGALALAAVVLAAAAAGGASRTLAVSGSVARPTSYTPAALQALPQAEATVPAPDGRPRVYRGVLLRDLIAAAQPIEAGRFDLRQSIVVARATDGYLAIFSWAELFNSPIGDGVLVAWSLDGSPLPDDEGAFALVSARDTRAGPRHVRWLESIEFRRVAT